MTDQSRHMTPDDFRRRGHQLVDWIADYWQSVGERPVLSQAAPGDVFNTLPPAAPVSGESFDEIIADLNEIIMPGITHWQSPNFFAYFPANVSGPAVLGELVSAGLGVQGMLWSTSPACTELETRVMDWLVEMLDLPRTFLSTGPGGGVIQDSASSAVLCALIAARERKTQGDVNRRGQSGGLTAYTSTQAHSSVAKAVRIAGIGDENLRLVDVDEDFAMRPEHLAELIDADIQAGLQPFFVSATLGTTSSHAMDPLPAIGEICRQHEIWLHVDAAHAGTAALCPEFRDMQAGLASADSYCFNPHKWMFTNFDCDCFWTTDRAALTGALGIMPEYLRNQATDSGAVIDYRDWQISLGRRFRALKLWFVIRHYGVEGLQHHVREHVDIAQQFASWVDADPDFEVVAPAPLNLVCFRHTGGDEKNRSLMAELNAGGRVFLTHTTLNDRFTMRLSVGGTATRLEHVKNAWNLIRKTAR
jgi:aromatic-L-amino-acid/L-tryptophan decarboxylase